MVASGSRSSETATLIHVKVVVDTVDGYSMSSKGLSGQKFIGFIIGIPTQRICGKLEAGRMSS